MGVLSCGSVVLPTNLSRLPPPSEFQPKGIHYQRRELLDSHDAMCYDVHDALRQKPELAPFTRSASADVKADSCRRWQVAEKVIPEQVADQVEETVEKVEEVAGVAPKSPVEKAKKSVGEAAGHVQKSHVVELTHQMMLAGIGAGVLAKEETEKLLRVLVERGTIAEEESRKLMQEAMAKRKKATGRAMRRAKSVEVELDSRVEEVLARMNIPTKAEIEALSAKISALTKKVDELKKGQ
jgi:poly(hydroxyalkanoate) granule-associated protein